MISAVIFDMDGVLVDSEPLWQAAQIELFGSIGVPLTIEMCRTTMGLRIDEVVAHWQRVFGWSEPAPEVMVNRVVNRVVELVRAEGELLPGVADALELFDSTGLRVALASSSYHRIVSGVLEACSLEGAFEVVVAGDLVAHGKPHPAIYLKALFDLGLDAPSCVAIEDSVNGVKAAKAASLACIAIPGRTESSGASDAADLTLGSLAELDSATWARFVALL